MLLAERGGGGLRPGQVSLLNDLAARVRWTCCLKSFFPWQARCGESTLLSSERRWKLEGCLVWVRCCHQLQDKQQMSGPFSCRSLSRPNPSGQKNDGWRNRRGNDEFRGDDGAGRPQRASRASMYRKRQTCLLARLKADRGRRT